MAIVRDRLGNIIAATTNKTYLQIAQDAAGIPEEEQVGAEKVNCIKRKLEELKAKAETDAKKEQQASKPTEDKIDG